MNTYEKMTLSETNTSLKKKKTQKQNTEEANLA